MSTHFVFSEYLDSVTKAFDLARGSYRLVLVLCATLVVFAIQGQPYKGSKKYLNHLVQAKADIDEKSGYIKGIDIVREIAHQGLLDPAEPAHEPGQQAPGDAVGQQEIDVFLLKHTQHLGSQCHGPVNSLK